MNNLLEKFKFVDPAKDEDVLAFEKTSGKKLPKDYADFLKVTNGGEGLISEHYIILWGIEELISLNHDYEVELNAPGLLIFGSDGGGEAYGFDTRDTVWRVVQIPFIGMFWDEAWAIADSFREFLEHPYRS